MGRKIKKNNKKIGKGLSSVLTEWYKLWNKAGWWEQYWKMENELVIDFPFFILLSLYYKKKFEENYLKGCLTLWLTN